MAELPRRGSQAERDLVRLFWNHGVGAVRVAGSGSTGLPSADIVAGGPGGLAVIEVKTTSSDRAYIPIGEIESLEKLSRALGATPWVIVKFKKLRRGVFYALPLSELTISSAGAQVTLDLAEKKGVRVEILAQKLAGKISELSV
ncbi:MAG TPA: Holliday junction resolvase [Candidatus Korarchaeota archaeon]|nr:Holliday junction resolvase [Candidatus Korarchaeota archaeon]